MKIIIGDMRRIRLFLCICVFVMSLMPWGGWVLATEWMPPLTLSGSLGFNYRTLDSPEGRNTVSRQGLGSLYASSYIYRPWLATTDMALTLAWDASESTGGTSQEVSVDSSIVTGVLNLNVLPKSRTPFNLRYSVTDTRVDNKALSSDALIVLGDGDATTHKLGLTQSFIAEGGHRARFIYDNNRWESSRNGIYEDQTAAVETDWRGKKQRLTVNAKFNDATRSKTASTNESTLVDATHYFYPTKELRLDTRASAYDSERDFDVPSSNLQSGISSSQVTQFSSFGFYRPHNNSPWSLSGGVRVFDMSGENTGLSNDPNDSESLVGTFGGYYAYNPRLRFDFNASYAKTDSNALKTESDREHLGALYQSDLYNFVQAKYQWFVQLSADNINQADRAEQNYGLSAGHSLSRAWFTEEGSVFRASMAQNLSPSYSTKTSDSVVRGETSVTLAWNKNAAGGSSYVQLTGSQGLDFRDSDKIGERYMAWFQANREQRISRRSSLSGNLSAQYVYHDFGNIARDSEVTTTTAKLNYRNRAIFSIPKLRFNSDLLVSRASEDRGIDRQEWENRFDYAIGQLTTSLSHRIIEHDDKRYTLSFFRIERHF